MFVCESHSIGRCYLTVGEHFVCSKWFNMMELNDVHGCSWKYYISYPLSHKWERWVAIDQDMLARGGRCIQGYTTEQADIRQYISTHDRNCTWLRSHLQELFQVDICWYIYVHLTYRNSRDSFSNWILHAIYE